MSLSDHSEWNDTMGGDCYFSVITQQMVRRKVVPLPRTKLRLMSRQDIQYIPRNMHTVFALLCFVVIIHWLIVPYPSGLLHWHCGNLTIAPVPAKQPWWIWIITSCEFIMNDCITTTKQSTTKPCAYFLGYTVTDQTMSPRWLKTPWCQIGTRRTATSYWLWLLSPLSDTST